MASSCPLAASSAATPRRSCSRHTSTHGKSRGSWPPMPPTGHGQHATSRRRLDSKDDSADNTRRMRLKRDLDRNTPLHHGTDKIAVPILLHTKNYPTPFHRLNGSRQEGSKLSLFCCHFCIYTHATFYSGKKGTERGALRIWRGRQKEPKRR